MKKIRGQRSEQLRRRQEQESQEAIRQATNRLVAMPSSAAYDRTMPLSEALTNEKPSAIKRHIKIGWRLLSFVIVILLSYTLITVWQTPKYRVSAVQLSGLQRIPTEEVLAELSLAGRHILALAPSQIEKDLQKQFPEFSDIEVQIKLPAQVSIHITERQPQIAWQAKDFLLWIDNEGFLIPARGTADVMLTIQANALPAYRLSNSIEESGTYKFIRDKKSYKPNPPVLAFFAQPKQIDKALLTAILQLNAWMPQEKTLLFQQQRGLGWSDVRGWDVYVGQKLEKINEKMMMYETIVKELDNQGIKPTMVSVEFLHAPYYRTD